MKPTKLRLIITNSCPRSCEGCCNRDINHDELPIVDHYNYDEILITGGEPLSDESQAKAVSLAHYLKLVDPLPNRKVYVYTSLPIRIHTHWYNFDGFTLTLHNQDDVKKFLDLNRVIKNFPPTAKSLRLNIFENVLLPEVDLSMWKVKKDIKWIANCPLPKDEILKRTRKI